MKRFVCISDGDIALLAEEEITQRLLQGTMFDEIFELGRPMELQIRLVPTKKSASKKEQQEEQEEQQEQQKQEESKSPAVKVNSGRGRRKKSSQAAAVN